MSSAIVIDSRKRFLGYLFAPPARIFTQVSANWLSGRDVVRHSLKTQFDNPMKIDTQKSIIRVRVWLKSLEEKLRPVRRFRLGVDSVNLQLSYILYYFPIFSENRDLYKNVTEKIKKINQLFNLSNFFTLFDLELNLHN